MDNKELKPGTTLYLPVFDESALFMAGNGHDVHGGGEVCTMAPVTRICDTFRLMLRKASQIDFPSAETPTHLMAI
jgi:acetamidase/formamidase